MTRRTFVSAATVLGAARLRAANKEPIATISMQPEYYHGWPTLVRRKSVRPARIHNVVRAPPQIQGASPGCAGSGAAVLAIQLLII